MRLPTVRTLEKNTAGRDFVVGDIHGMFARSLDAFLQAVQFDETKDRVISVGDLVDRGPGSSDALKYLRNPWFYAVYGNHEDMLVHFVKGDNAGSDVYGSPGSWNHSFILNGGEWFLDMRARHKSNAEELVDMIAELPDILVVGDGPSRYNVVHAELVHAFDEKTGQITFYKDSDVDNSFSEFADDPPQHIIGFDTIGSMRDGFLWGRRLVYLEKAVKAGRYKDVYFGHPSLTSGLSPTFCGHTILKSPQIAYSHVRIDTGAYKSVKPNEMAYLTIAEPLAGRIWQVGRSNIIKEGIPLLDPLDRPRDGAATDPQRESRSL